MLKSCFFVGHKTVTITPQLAVKLRTTVEEFIQQGVTKFYAGGAIGWDIFCEKTIMEFKKIYPDIKLTLILPEMKFINTKGWNAANKKDYLKLYCAADDVKMVVGHKRLRNCIKERNEHLINHSDMCICYYDPRLRSSITDSCVRAAVKKGIPIINLNEDFQKITDIY